VLVLVLEFGEGRKWRGKSKTVRGRWWLGFGRGAAGCDPGVAACLHERRKGAKRLFRMYQPGFLWAP